MKKDSEFTRIRVSGIEYDPEDAVRGLKLPKSVTVEANRDMPDCLVEEDGSVDEAETAEYVSGLVEEKTGATVLNFKYEIKD